MLSTRPIALEADIDVASQPILHAKTPGRKTLKNRAALQENAVIHSGAKTVLSKKNVLQTPFRPGTAHGKKPPASVSVTRPLMDKTPFPNRVAPAAGIGASKTPGLKGSKLSKLALLLPEPEQAELLSLDVAPLLRPSSTRKSLRGRLSGAFKTPVTKGDHWNVSPGDMELDIAGGTAEQAAPETLSVEDEDDEIEYMPPTAIDPPYEPPFELPDYKSMGTKLFNLGHAPLFDDTLDVFYARDIEEQLNVQDIVASGGPQPGSSHLDGLDLPELEDDSPFARKAPKAAISAVPPKSTVPAAPAPSTRPVSTIATGSKPSPRPATTVSQSRSSSRTTTSYRSAPAPARAPAPTRTSALRAAKAAASSNNATTQQPSRPTTSAVARSASIVPLRRAATGIPVAKLSTGSRPANAATIVKVPSATAAGTTARGRSATTTSTNATNLRARSANVTAPSSRAKAPSAVGPARIIARVDDPLAQSLESFVGCADEDFMFEV
ncbi:hypothetical protein BD414DRAFT_469542 [Trametes punicea]|nr:hypothetical protein BD414DRAFT_469542 [Trametes punicea]